MTHCILFRMKFCIHSIQVEAINASKLKTYVKCDDSFTFAVYVDKPKDGMYYVVYIPRTLKIWRTRELDEAELLRDQLNSYKVLVSILGNISRIMKVYRVKFRSIIWIFLACNSSIRARYYVNVFLLSESFRLISTTFLQVMMINLFFQNN